MTKLALLLAISLSSDLTGVAAEDTGVVTLENRVLRMDIRKAPAPFIERLVHKASGQAVIAAPANKSLFSIILAKDDGSSEMVESAQAGESSASAAGKVVLKYAKFPSLDLAVEVTASCDEKNPLTLWTMRVANNTGRRLKAVRFPQLVAVPSIGDSKDDVLVLPAYAGTLIENPAENWRNGHSMTLRYPGDMSAQFLAYQDRTAGVYLAGMDTAGHPMSLGVSKQADGIRCWHEFTIVSDGPKTAAGVWQSPYPVALGVTQGRWCNTADQYKQWAVRQKWCAKTLAARRDIPAWWKDGPDVHVCEVRTYDGTRSCTGSYYPKLQDHLRAFREKINGPIVPMLGGWENHRRWTGGDYFPVFDAENARRIIPQLKQDGFRSFFYLSGLFYTYWNEGRDGGEIPAAQQYAASYVPDEKTGKPKEYVLNESSPTGTWKRHSYQFCVSAPQTKPFFCGVIDRAHALGVDVLQMDQTTGGAGDACHSTTHGHAPGAGLYQSRAFWDLLDAMRAHGKRLSPDFVLFHEESHEQLIPHLDGFHVREYYEKRWYRGHPGAVGIPLFSYLYHEFAAGYGGDSASLSKENNRWNVRCHAMNLIAGRTPGGSIWSSHQNMFDAHPDQIAMIRNHCRLLKTRAKEFLMLGRMLHSYELSVPKLTITLPVQRSGKWVLEDLPTPAILTSSWQSPNGRIGHLFVNIAETKQALKVNLDTRNAPAGKSFDTEIWRSTAQTSFTPLWQAAQLPKEFVTELEPTEAVFIELRKRQ
ncbi:MAG: DUF6259 domain-containing protein [Verrucomicrobia bacterium]|nr:DUF6259 domain-containing protein [Verrucomicrobiota bacterium]